MLDRRGEDLIDTFSLREVIELTGLSKLVLHAWERRYGTVSPDRSETGRRAYSRDDVARLGLLKTCTDLGHRIGKIASLPSDELQRIVSNHQRIVRLEPIFNALDALDNRELEQILNSQYLTLGPIAFAKEVVTPLMHEVGARWAAGALSITAEHMVSAAVRSLLGHGMKMLPAGNKPLRMIFTTPEGELHELGTLICALIAQSHGARTIFLGAQMPAKQIAEACAKTQTHIVCLGSQVSRMYKGRQGVVRIREALPDSVALWLGGPGFSDDDVVPDTCYFKTITDFETAVELKIGSASAAEQ
jgi:MerR family transcriptional regulator, light-induced transcriptional regulator